MIQGNRYEMVFGKGETIVKQGSACTHVISFSSGLAKLFLESEDNKQPLILRLVKPVEFISGIGMFTNHLHHYSIIALEKSCVCLINTDTFREILDVNKAFSSAYMTHIHTRLEYTFAKIASFQKLNNRGRMAESLRYLSADVFQASTFELPLNRKELSELAGITREGCSRIISEFAKSGLIAFDDNTITILKPDLILKISKYG